MNTAPTTTRADAMLKFLLRCADKGHSLHQQEKEAIRRAYLFIWNRQLNDEKSLGTVHHNGIGFNGQDGKFAVSLSAGWAKYGSWTDNQYHAVSKMLKKYVNTQLSEMPEPTARIA